MEKYTIGIDFGTLSARAVLVKVGNGEVVSSASCNYAHGVMDQHLPDGTPLMTDWALQHAQDYFDSMVSVVKTVMQESGVNPENVIGIGSDFTACTILPIYKDGTPLHMDEKFNNEPNAYVKLWKHHAAEPLADKLTAMAKEQNMPFLDRYGGKISSEWQLPKVWQIIEEAPQVYDACDYIVEGADWISFKLTGVLTKNSCCAGYKGNWHYEEGYPSKAFLCSLNPKFENYVSDKLDYPIVNPGECCGLLTKEMADQMNLVEGIPVSASIIDAMASFPATGITTAGQMQAAIGTSTCQIVLSEKENAVPGITGVVYGGVYPGIYAYETGQAAVGDIFAWFVDNLLSDDYVKQAEALGINKHTYLNQLAEKLEPGQNGLIALDWWNGNRSILSNYDLTGLIVGMTLATKPEEIYRALLESTAYGTRVLIENHRNHGVEINEYIAAGGISVKSPLTMQIYADVLNMPISIADVNEGGALGSACYAAAAAGKDRGGYDSIYDAAQNMGKMRKHAFKPMPENVQAYDKLYREYVKLHDYFGRGGNDVMIELKKIRREILEKNITG